MSKSKMGKKRVRAIKKIENKDLEKISNKEITILNDLYTILVKESMEHIIKEKQKIREQYPRLEPFVGLAAPELAKLIEKIKNLKA